MLFLGWNMTGNMTGNDCNWTLSQLTRLGHKMCAKQFFKAKEQRFQSQCKCMKLKVVYGHAYNIMGNEGPGLFCFWNRGSLRAMRTASHGLSAPPVMATILDIQPS
jgi:hypothetical protein